MKKAIVALAVVGVLTVVILLATAPSTEVVLVNASAGTLTDVSFVIVDGDERSETTAESVRPGWTRAAGCGKRKMPHITVAWREGENAYRFEEHTDLWSGETWRVEIQTGGRVLSGYYRDEAISTPNITALEPVDPR